MLIDAFFQNRKECEDAVQILLNAFFVTAQRKRAWKLVLNSLKSFDDLARANASTMSERISPPPQDPALSTAAASTESTVALGDRAVAIAAATAAAAS